MTRNDLLAGLRAIPTSDGLRFQIPAEDFKPYGAWQNEGTGVYGPTGQPITPARSKYLRWIDNNTGQVRFARSVRGTNEHKGWWTRWVKFRAPAAVGRGWKRRVG